MAIYRTESDSISGNAAGGDSGSTGRTYSVMAVPSPDRSIPVQTAVEPAKRTARGRQVKRRPLVRIAAGLLLAAAMITLPLWLTTDGLLPVMKRISAAAMSVQLPEQSMETVSGSSLSPVTSGSTTTTTMTAASTSATASPTTSASPSEGSLPVLEKQLGDSGTKVGSIYVKNSTGYTPDFESLLEKKADCRIKLNAGYQVLIVHTHTTECYAQSANGFYSPDYSPRTTDSSQSVVAVGDVLAQKLEAAGIRTLHATETHDHPRYNGSYDRALDTIEKYLKEYPSIEMVLDVHRDAITYDDGTKLKPTALIDGRKAAQVMIITGCDANGRLYFPDWEKNLTMALQIQQSAQEKHPGLMRPVNFAPYRYNMHMTPNSLLLEFGTDANTLEEALFSAELMGDAIADLLLSYDVSAK